MKNKIERLIKAVFKNAGIGILSYNKLQKLIENQREGFDTKFLSKLPDEHILFFLKIMSNSRSQLRQDLFVLSELQIKNEGFFVEFGASDGIHLSNTYLLEKDFGWNGILAEPAKCWHRDLHRNRACHIDTRCVWSVSESTLIFNQTNLAEFSTVDDYSSVDFNELNRKSGEKYEVKTISLLDLLDKYSAPKNIDYLSIDTEGSEFEILKNFDFDKYYFNVITCEHNHTESRNKIHELLISKGYVRKFEDISLFDDWYIRA